MIFQHNSYYILTLSICLQLDATVYSSRANPARTAASLTRNVVWDKFTSRTNSRLQLLASLLSIYFPHTSKCQPRLTYLPYLWGQSNWPSTLALDWCFYFSLTFSWKDIVNKLCHKLPSILLVIANSFNLYVLCLMNFLLSDVKLICLFSRNSKLSERSTTEKYVLKHEFQICVCFFRERSEMWINV